jgi:hypothetical protein
MTCSAGGIALAVEGCGEETRGHSTMMHSEEMIVYESG